MPSGERSWILRPGIGMPVSTRWRRVGPPPVARSGISDPGSQEEEQGGRPQIPGGSRRGALRRGHRWRGAAPNAATVLMPDRPPLVEPHDVRLVADHEPPRSDVDVVGPHIVLMPGDRPLDDRALVGGPTRERAPVGQETLEGNGVAPPQTRGRCWEEHERVLLDINVLRSPAALPVVGTVIDPARDAGRGVDV